MIRHARLTGQITAVHAGSRGTYGARRVHAELTLGQGLIAGHGTVELLMRRAGIKGLPGSRRPRPKHETPTAGDLVRRQFAASAQPVTFTAVAARAGIGRATLYRNPALRAVIDDHRRNAASANTLTGLADDIAALRLAIEAIATRVRRNEEQIPQLNREKQPGSTRQQ